MLLAGLRLFPYWKNRTVNTPMKNKPLLVIALAALALSLVGTRLLHAQDRGARQQYEYAMLKWDGPDRIQICYPDRFESYRVFEKGVGLPRGAHDEEFCVNYAVNILARDGWQAIQLHSTRVMLQRPVK
jgi:hypothetical protein